MPEDDFMKSLGYPGSAATAASKKAEPGGPGHVPTYDELDYQQKAGQGVAKFGAQTLTGIPRAINAGIGLASPNLREKLGDLAERIPGVKRMEAFAASPSEGGWETAGNVAATGASMLVNPFKAFGIAQKLPGVVNAVSAPGREAAAFTPALKPVVNRLGEVDAARGDLGRLAEIAGRTAPEAEKLPEAAVRPRLQFTEAPQRTFRRGEPVTPVATKTFGPGPPPGFKEEIGKYFGSAAAGAAQGATSDPNDPGAGAVLGGVTGGAMPAAGKFFQTEAGQWVADMLARHGPYAGMEAIAAALHVPLATLWMTGLAQFALWHSSPGGQFFGRIGRRAASSAGRFLEHADPRLPGAGFGGLENLVEQGTVSFPGGGGSEPATEDTEQ
jgi:hypothetical protein